MSPVWHNVTVAAQALGLQLHVVEVRRADEFDTAFAAMTRASADALIVLEDSLLLSGLRDGLRSWPPRIGCPRCTAGDIMWTLGASCPMGQACVDMYRRAAAYVDKILKGTKPADLPVEQPTKFELVINLKTAKALGLTIPPSILFQADEVIR